MSLNHNLLKLVLGIVTRQSHPGHPNRTIMGLRCFLKRSVPFLTVVVADLGRGVG